MQTLIAKCNSGSRQTVAITNISGGAANGASQANRALINSILGSKIYKDYAEAFTKLTGLPLALTPVESWRLPHHGRFAENPFCAMLAQKNRACGACLQTQGKLCSPDATEAKTVTCQTGMSDTSVPVRIGEKLVGFLHTGQTFRRQPTEKLFNRTANLVAEWGITADRKALHDVYFSSKVIPMQQHESMVSLLEIFSQHLAMLGNQFFMQQSHAELPVITRAKAYIDQHRSEELTLGQVAKHVNTSRFYFCKLFKKATGINFTSYVSHVRVERAKNLLLNPNLRVSEIAFEAGFQSLTHFNRLFKKNLGQSPTKYREQLLKN